jgi:hypothetical protein
MRAVVGALAEAYPDELLVILTLYRDRHAYFDEFPEMEERVKTQS